jgi:hypothetical protein
VGWFQLGRIRSGWVGPGRVGSGLGLRRVSRKGNNNQLNGNPLGIDCDDDDNDDKAGNSNGNSNGKGDGDGNGLDGCRIGDGFRIGDGCRIWGGRGLYGFLNVLTVQVDG